MNPKVKHYILKSPRLILGVIFILSGVGKLIDSESARYMIELMATEFYWLVGWKSEIVLATIFIELFLAVFLILGKQLMKIYLAAFLMIAVFTGISGYFWAQGYNVASCGCFGAFGLSGGLKATFIRNVILLIVVIAGVWIQNSTEKKEHSEINSEKEFAI